MTRILVYATFLPEVIVDYDTEFKSQKEFEDLIKEFSKYSKGSAILYDYYWRKARTELGKDARAPALQLHMIAAIKEDAQEPGRLDAIAKANKKPTNPFDVLYGLWVLLCFFIGIGGYLITMVILEAASFALVGHQLPRFVYDLPIVAIMGASKSADSPSFGAFATGFAMSGVFYYLSLMLNC